MPPSECTGLSNGGFGFSSTNDVCTKTNMLSTQTSASSPSMPMVSSPDLASASAKFSDPASPSYAQVNHASSRLHSSDLPTSPVAQLTLAHAASLLLPTDDVTSPLGLRNIASMKTVTKATTILAHSESMTTEVMSSVTSEGSPMTPVNSLPPAALTAMLPTAHEVPGVACISAITPTDAADRLPRAQSRFKVHAVENIQVIFFRTHN